jgi:signal transduction histidine kinase
MNSEKNTEELINSSRLSFSSLSRAKVLLNAYELSELPDDQFRSQFDFLDWGLNFIDPQLRKEFGEYMSKRKLYKVVLIYAAFYSVVFPTCVAEFFFLWPNYWSAWIYSSLSFCIVTASAFISWVIYFDDYFKTTPLKPWLPVMQNIIIINQSLFFVLNSTRSVWTDCNQFPKDYRNYFLSSDCYYDRSFVPDWSLAALTICPLLNILAYSDVRLDYMMFIGVIANAAWVAFTFIYAPGYTYFWTGPVHFFIVGVMCVELHLSRVVSFLKYKQLQFTLAENKRMQDENRATELRNMIGNVAHDLKTPLSSFMSGIDIMSHTIEELEKYSYTNTIISSEHIQATLKPFVECFKNIRNTNSFMLMTINRCIDYTKASKGMKLKPKYETIDLLDSLMLPIDCMKNIQERIRIELQRLPKEICAHIITDKQWLQENVLCLLSNAVKYSTEGTVTIGVSLEDRFSEETIIEEDVSVEEDEEEAAVAPEEIQKSGEVSLDSGSFGMKALPFVKAVSMKRKNSRKIYVEASSENKQIDNKTSSKSQQSQRQTAIRPKDILIHKYLRIEIADHGIGLSDEAMNQLFNPFQQAQKLAGGTGN